MAVEYAGSGTASIASGSATTLTPGTVANTAENDIILLAARADGAINIPSGFTRIADERYSSTSRFALFWKRSTGSESQYVVTGTNVRSAQAHRYTGAKISGDPFRAIASSHGTTSSTSSQPLSLTGLAAGDRVAWFGGTNVAKTLTVPGGFTERGKTTNSQVYAADTVSTSDSVGPVTMTYDSGAVSMSALVAFIPESNPIGNVVIGGLRVPLKAISRIISGAKQPLTPSIIRSGVKTPPV